MRQIKSLLFFIGLSLLLVNCDASKKSNNDNNKKSDEIIFGKANSLILGNTKNYQSITLPEIKMKAFFTRKFDDSKGFKDFNIFTKNEKDYYLICKGSREGDDSQFAIELEVNEESNLILQDVNKLYYTCIARYCDACAFKYNKNGTIGGCDCEKKTKDKPTGYAACEHTIAIKTEEKE